MSASAVFWCVLILLNFYSCFIFKTRKLKLKECVKPFSSFSVSKHSWLIRLHFQFTRLHPRGPQPSLVSTPPQPSPRSQPFCNIPLLSSWTRLLISVRIYPSCANLYKRSVNDELQSSFRVLILGEDVQTGAPRLPIMTGRL